LQVNPQRSKIKPRPLFFLIKKSVYLTRTTFTGVSSFTSIPYTIGCDRLWFQLEMLQRRAKLHSSGHFTREALKLQWVYRFYEKPIFGRKAKNILYAGTFDTANLLWWLKIVPHFIQLCGKQHTEFTRKIIMRSNA